MRGRGVYCRGMFPTILVLQVFIEYSSFIHDKHRVSNWWFTKNWEQNRITISWNGVMNDVGVHQSLSILRLPVSVIIYYSLRTFDKGSCQQLRCTKDHTHACSLSFPLFSCFVSQSEVILARAITITSPISPHRKKWHWCRLHAAIKLIHWKQNPPAQFLHTNKGLINLMTCDSSSMTQLFNLMRIQYF